MDCGSHFDLVVSITRLCCGYGYCSGYLSTAGDQNVVESVYLREVTERSSKDTCRKSQSHMAC